MIQDEARKRIGVLRREIEKYRYAYHVLDQSLISDAALDSLKKELEVLERQYPELITPDSPTQRIGGKPLKFFKQVKRRAPMTSLNDAFSEEDVRDWHKRIQKLIPRGAKVDFYCEHKFDGLAISLEYEKGVFARGSTRGDGKTGEDVTQNLKTIESIPLRLRDKNINSYHLPDRVEVRGEVLLTKQEFQKINQGQIKKGLSPYANPRNIAAGSIRQLDPKITASRHLVFYAYDLIADFSVKTHEEKHVILKSLGFKIHPEDKKANSLEEVFRIHREVYKQRAKLTYEIDGLVVTVNDNGLFEQLGAVGKAPRGALAYKFFPEEATTIIEDIIVQVGRTGVFTPVALLKPVAIRGVKISRSTLHNKEEIKRLGLKIGDTVIVNRAGDVIPQVAKVLPHLRTGKEKTFSLPKNCPICHTPAIEDKGGIIVRCPNKKCPARSQERLYHFISKAGFDMKGLGPKIINRLLDEGLIQDAGDLFDLKEGDIQVLERYGEKSSQNIVKTIKAHKKILFNRFLYSLSILHLGEENALILARYLQQAIKLLPGSVSIRALIDFAPKFTREKLSQIKSFGPIISESITSWFQDQVNLDFLKKLGSKGIIIQAVPAQAAGKLQNLTFIFTGALESMSREQAKAEIIKRGGQVVESVSAKTSYLVAGENPGSKYQNAKRLGIKIITEKEFLKMI